MDCAKKKVIKRTREIECTQENPWDHSSIPDDSIVVHDNVRVVVNSCFSIYSCQNCGFEWMEEFKW